MKQIAFSMIVSVLTAAYWWIVFTLVYADALFAGDSNRNLSPPPERDVLIHNAATIIIGVLLYALVMLLLYRVTIGGRR